MRPPQRVGGKCCARETDKLDGAEAETDEEAMKKNALIRGTCYFLLGVCGASGPAAEAGRFDHCDLFGKKRRADRTVVNPAGVADHGYYATRWRRSFLPRHTDADATQKSVVPEQVQSSPVPAVPAYERDEISPRPGTTIPTTTIKPSVRSPQTSAESLSQRAARVIRPRAPLSPSPPPPSESLAPLPPLKSAASKTAESPSPDPAKPIPLVTVRPAPTLELKVREARTIVLDPFPPPKARTSDSDSSAVQRVEDTPPK